MSTGLKSVRPIDIRSQVRIHNMAQNSNQTQGTERVADRNQTVIGIATDPSGSQRMPLMSEQGLSFSGSSPRVFQQHCMRQPLRGLPQVTPACTAGNESSTGTGYWVERSLGELAKQHLEVNNRLDVILRTCGWNLMWASIRRNLRKEARIGDV
jgi:hypothetical protein